MGELTVNVIIFMVLGLLVLSLGFFFVTKILNVGGEVDALSACENPSGTQPGMCVHQDTICAGVLGYASGKALSGCPSDRIEGLIEGRVEDPSLYNTCCLAATCEQVFDVLDGKSTARQSACFTDDCEGEKKVEQTECAGFSQGCTADEGCCCVLGS